MPNEKNIENPDVHLNGAQEKPEKPQIDEALENTISKLQEEAKKRVKEANILE
jgi:hypothetical protein